MIIAVALAFSLLPTMAAAECRTFTSGEMRNLVIKGLIKEGMTERQVERSWGKPTKKRSNSSGNVWEYWNPTGDQIVEFGRDGCVRGWRTMRD